MKSFLKKGASYRLLGGSPLPELMQDPEEFKSNDVLRVELSPLSALYQQLHNGGEYELTAELSGDIPCFGIECSVDSVRVVKVGQVYYEFVERPCVQMLFYPDAKQISRLTNSRYNMCANSDLAHAREACCLEDNAVDVRYAHMVTNVTYFYDGERMSFAAAKQRCMAYGKDLCQFEGVSVYPNNDGWRTGYHWTNRGERSQPNAELLEIDKVVQIFQSHANTPPSPPPPPPAHSSMKRL